MVDCVYICSAGHSGSTLLDLLLGSHSKATSLGEVTHLPKNLALNTLCACGAAVRSCDFWQRIVRALGDRIGADLMANPYALNLGYHRGVVIVDKSHQTAAYRGGCRYMCPQLSRVSGVSPLRTRFTRQHRLIVSLKSSRSAAIITARPRTMIGGPGRRACRAPTRFRASH